MLLRSRIALMVSLSMGMLAAALIGRGALVEGRLDGDFRSAVVAGDQNAWNGTELSATRLLDGFATLLGREDAFAHGVATRNRKQIDEVITALQSIFQAAYLNVSIEVATPDGDLLYPAEGTTEVLSKGLVRRVLTASSPLRGLVQTTKSDYRLAVVFPLSGRSGPIGVLTFSAPASQVLDDFSKAVDAQAALVAADGVVARARWTVEAPELSSGKAELFDLTDRKGRIFGIDRVELRSIQPQGSVWLLAARDKTAFEGRRRLIDLLTYIGLTCALSLFLAYLYWYFRTSFRPLDAIIHVLRALSAGDTSVKVPPANSRDEIGRLAGTVEAFRQAQRDRAQLQVIRQDLAAASTLQQAVLPHGGIDCPSHSVEAAMKAARDVGGDFYDYFPLPDGRLGVVMADVSGKGMAAALFMAISRTVIRTVAAMAEGPGDCLTKANAILAADNEAMMFVTVFYGVLDTGTGRLCYANAGHNPPCLLAADDLTELPRTGGKPLGLFEGVRFAEKHVDLAPGDRVFLYTDGVTEAFNPAGQEFGTDRMKEVLADLADDNGLPAMFDAVEGFANGAPQSDDMTCMLLRWNGSTCSSEGADK
ncbi:MAG: PP2C family protein-serine/threonine phosphatase [Actinomycetota bacterium]